MDSRAFNALELAARAKIEQRGTYWFVPSATHQGGYRVDHAATECSCEDFELRQEPCKHVLAVRIVKDRNRSRPVADITDESGPPKKPTYRQQWPAYNAAQRAEKRLFQVLLADLCRSVPDPPRKPTGRPPIPRGDALFAAVFKVYSTVSGRRFSTDLSEAERAGHVAQAPHYNSVFRVLEDEATTTELQALIATSSRPLRAVETDFAVDSSGFGTSRFSRWFDAKYGVERSKAEYVKTHVCVGVRTQVVTAVEVSDRHDSQPFPDLIRATAGRFRVGDVTADKAYLSRENLELVESLGGSPLVPFKSNNRADKNGATWERLFHYFHLHRAEFLPRYHQRSNVESAFSMMKRKFGDSVRSKTEVACRNEVLAKVLCHNLVVVVHEMHELGIVPDFGGESESDEPRAVIPFPGVG